MLKFKYLIMSALLAVVVSGCSASNDRGFGFRSIGSNKDAAQIAENASSPSKEELSNTVSTAFVETLDAGDLLRLQEAQLTAFDQPRGGVPIVWQNPETCRNGKVTSGPTYTINGRRCRDFIHSITIDGVLQSENGVACQQTNGAWQAIPS